VRVSPPPRRRAPRPAVLAAFRGPGGWWRPGEGAHRSRDSHVPEPCSSAAEKTEFRFLTGQKGLFFDLFSPLGARKRALRRNCAARRVETSYLRARAERGAAGASRGRAGAEKRKSSFLGRVGTTLSRMKLYSSYCKTSTSSKALPSAIGAFPVPELGPLFSKKKVESHTKCMREIPIQNV
jgi:hypothetical protein